jgi:hypothetical protein
MISENKATKATNSRQAPFRKKRNEIRWKIFLQSITKLQ